MELYRFGAGDPADAELCAAIAELLERDIDSIGADGISDGIIGLRWRENSEEVALKMRALGLDLRKRTKDERLPAEVCLFSRGESACGVAAHFLEDRLGSVQINFLGKGRKRPHNAIKKRFGPPSRIEDGWNIWDMDDSIAASTDEKGIEMIVCRSAREMHRRKYWKDIKDPRGAMTLTWGDSFDDVCEKVEAMAADGVIFRALMPAEPEFGVPDVMTVCFMMDGGDVSMTATFLRRRLVRVTVRTIYPAGATKRDAQGEARLLEDQLGKCDEVLRGGGTADKVWYLHGTSITSCVMKEEEFGRWISIVTSDDSDALEDILTMAMAIEEIFDSDGRLKRRGARL